MNAAVEGVVSVVNNYSDGHTVAFLALKTCALHLQAMFTLVATTERHLYVA